MENAHNAEATSSCVMENSAPSTAAATIRIANIHILLRNIDA